MVKSLRGMAAFLKFFFYLLYIFRTEPKTMRRQLTEVSELRWGWIISALEADRYLTKNNEYLGQQSVSD